MNSLLRRPLRVLMVEDSPDDELLILEHMQESGYEPYALRVQTPEDMKRALTERWDVILCDYRLPEFGGMEALEILQSAGVDIPLIVVSGAIGEEAAVAMMRSGARDYILKKNLLRLGAAIEREIEAQAKRRALRQSEQAAASARAAYERGLRESEKQYRELFERNLAGVFRGDLDGNLIECNEAAARIFGYSRDEIYGFNVSAVWADPSQRPALLRRIFEEKSITNVEVTCRRKDGELITILENVALIDGSPPLLEGTFIDITERKRAQEALAASEGRYRALVENIPDVTWTLDQTGRTTYISPSCAKVIGFEAEEFAALSMEARPARIHPEDRERLEQALTGLFTEGTLMNVEYRFQRKDGRWIWIHDRAYSTYQRNGVRHADGIFSDITAKKKAEEDLRASERRYRAIIDHAPLGFFQKTLSEEWVMANSRLAEILGCGSVEELLAHRPGEFYADPADREKLIAAFSRDGFVENHVLHIRRVDGVERWVALDLRVTAEEGRDLVQGFAHDVTVRVEHEAARAALATELHLLLESAFDGILVVDLDGRCTMVNQAACRTLGWEAGELVGHRIHDRIHNAHAAETCQCYNAMTRSAQGFVTDESFVRSDGTRFPVEFAHATILEAGSPKGIIITFRDVSEKQMMTRQLEQASRLSSLGRVAATIAHEFNNVLMGIQTFADILGRRTPQDDMIARTAQHITSSVARGKQIVGEILRFTRPVAPVAKPILIRSWLDDLHRELQALLPATITLDVDCPRPPLRLLGDDNQLRQVMVNLVLNAGDAMPEGGRLTIHVSRPVRGARFPFGILPGAERFIHIAVTDTGCGIPPDILAHVFEPMFTTKRSGTGLGLAVCHQIIKLHEGAIFVESTPATGTTFHLFLPLAAEQSDAAAGVVADSPGPRLRILIVDHDEAATRGLAGLLEQKGMEVEVVRSGDAALAATERRIPDALIVELALADRNGLDVYRALEERRPRLPVIFSAGGSDRASLGDLSERPNVALATRPYEEDALLATLVRVTGGR